MTSFRLVIVLLAVGSATAHDLGNMLGFMNHSHDAPGIGGGKMERTFQKYVDLPMGAEALREAGWVKNEFCNPVIGHMWTQGGATIVQKTPLVLFTTSFGQPSGVGVEISGDLPALQQKWAVIQFPGLSLLTVAFRKGDIICSGEKSAMALGDSLIVNPGGPASKELALTESAARNEGWYRGSCFDGMGWHNLLDTHMGQNQMSWEAENVFPVVTMYNEGQINAIFFASWVVQQGAENPNQWDPFPLPNKMMCANMCDSECHFEGTTTWSTFHVYFNDHNLVKCDPSLKCLAPGIGCCPQSVVV